MKKHPINLEKLSDEQVLKNIVNATDREKRATAWVVAYLAELQKRNLVLERSYPSLYVYAREVLKYSNGSSFRRVAAAYLSIEFPKTIEELAKGNLTLCAASEMWSTFQKEREFKKKKKESSSSSSTSKTFTAPSKKEKKELFESVLGKSTTEARREFREFENEKYGESIKKTRGKLIPISKNATELRAELDNTFLGNFEKLQSLLSHKITDGDPAEIVRFLIELGLETLDPVRIQARIDKRKQKKQAQKKSTVEAQSDYKAGRTSTMDSSTQDAENPTSRVDTQNEYKQPRTSTMDKNKERPRAPNKPIKKKCLLKIQMDVSI